MLPGAAVSLVIPLATTLFVCITNYSYVARFISQSMCVWIYHGYERMVVNVFLYFLCSVCTYSYVC
jgi:hypothetical protein